MIIKREVYETLCQTFGSNTWEMGGILGESEGRINSFYFDKTGISDLKSYIPDVRTLNYILTLWKKQNISFIGLVHTHKRNKYLSASDLHYGKEIADSFKKNIIMGIFVVETQELFLYQIYQSNSTLYTSKLEYEITD